MKIAVVGLWHLGMVTAASLAAVGHIVCAIDDPSVISAIERGKMPVDEPGLADLVTEQKRASRLAFTADARAAGDAELIWICYDTPVDDSDRPDVDSVIERASEFLASFAGSAVVAVSSQLPVGSTAVLEQRFPDGRFAFACIPENLRLGSAIAYFRNPDRFVIGTRSGSPAKYVIERALGTFAKTLVFMSVESAEMTKHSINAFLATSVTFANELASICERVGADAREVERGLKSDGRVGPKAYVRAGESFSGGTLARDLGFLANLGDDFGLPLEQVRATASSNVRHRDWALDRVCDFVGDRPVRIAFLGLVYKPGTDTLRASNAVNLARTLRDLGHMLVGFDPAISVGDERLAGILEISSSVQAALMGAEIAVIATSWPVFREVPVADFKRLMKRCNVIDESRFLEETLRDVDDINYAAFGLARVVS